MSRKIKVWLIVGVVCIVAATAVWRLWSLAVAREPVVQDLEQSALDLAHRASEFLERHSRAMGPADSAQAFESASALQVAQPDLELAGLTRADAEAAMAHAAAMMYTRFVEKNYERYTAWRTDAGYRFFPAERLRQDPVYRAAIESGAGRALRDDEQDTTELWRLYCKK